MKFHSSLQIIYISNVAQSLINYLCIVMILRICICENDFSFKESQKLYLCSQFFFNHAVILAVDNGLAACQ